MSNKPKLKIKRFTLIQGDAIKELRRLATGSVDSIVTDPPYELGFMGKGWDRSGIANNVELWKQAFRVLKNGGHLLAFGGTRTYHRMVCAIEDAGFDIRDQIGWVYGSGFPKSLDVSKAIDKEAGAGREVVGTKLGRPGMAKDGRNQSFDSSVNTYGGGGVLSSDITAPATDAARQWQGWGTALKPAWEPICMARKPLVGTIAANVQKHGVGALNIDGCRIGSEVVNSNHTAMLSFKGKNARPWHAEHENTMHEHIGRWPANIIHDGSDEVLGMFPQAQGQLAAITGDEPTANGFSGTVYGYGGKARRAIALPREDTGSAARFFYCAKADNSDRNEWRVNNTHPTVKPTALMRWLCRLVTPKGGTVLDPFMGSGSTGKAAMKDGFRFIGIEKEQEYFLIAEERIKKQAAENRLFHGD